MISDPLASDAITVSPTAPSVVSSRSSLSTLAPLEPLKPLVSQGSKLTLDQLSKGARAVITHIDANPQGSEIALRLMELGFVEGEVVRVVAKGYFAGAPTAVRVGGTTFALRRFEAALISVVPLTQPAFASATQADESEIT